MTNLEAAYERLQKAAHDQERRKEICEQKIADYETKLASLQHYVQIRHEGRELLIQSAKVSRERTIGFVEKAVTHAIRAVFQDSTLHFKIETGVKRGALEAEYLVEWEVDGIKVRESPSTAKGGSFSDVISAALRLVFLNRFKPQRRKILVLDEPGKFIEPENLIRFARWLRRISKEFKIQMIIISHREELIQAADKVFELRKDSKGAVKVKTKKGMLPLAGYGIKT